MVRNIVLVVLGLALAYFGYKVYVLRQNSLALSDVETAYKSSDEDGYLNVVEFLDYSCPFCREAHPTITEAIKRDGAITYIPRPIAFMGDKSLYAARVVYAAGEQDKFFEMHNAVMENFDRFNPETMPEIAERADVDPEQLQQDLEVNNFDPQIEENLKLLRNMGGKATPSFVIGSKIFYAPEGKMPTVQDFLDMFEEARGKLGEKDPS